MSLVVVFLMDSCDKKVDNNKKKVFYRSTDGNGVGRGKRGESSLDWPSTRVSCRSRDISVLKTTTPMDISLPV